MIDGAWMVGDEGKSRSQLRRDSNAKHQVEVSSMRVVISSSGVKFICLLYDIDFEWLMRGK